MKTSEVKICKVCLNNPEITNIFTEHDVVVKLYDAKSRSIIDADTLIKLLDYFKGVKNDDN